MNIEKLAYEVGRRLAKTASSQSQEEYIAGLNQESPILSKVLRNGAIGAGVGLGLGGLSILGRHRGLHPGKGEWNAGIRTKGQIIADHLASGATVGGSLGALSGMFRGSHDAGLLTGYQDRDDNPVVRAGLGGAVMGYDGGALGSSGTGLISALLAARGQHSGAALRRQGQQAPQQLPDQGQGG